jgi:hypothetical protein
MSSLKTHYRGVARADLARFTASRFEIQVEYTTGWKTIGTPPANMVEAAWSAARHQWSTLNLRLLRDGRKFKTN